MEDFEKFAYSSAWLRALHYEKTWSGRYRSRIDDPRFFVSDKGRGDPYAELRTSIALATDPNQKPSFRCRAPLRYRRLLEMGLIRKGSPQTKQRCDELDYFKKEFGSGGLDLVFVAQYADNPSSIMGHLFFRFENPDRQVEGQSLPYLFKTLNYAAAIPRDTNILKYMAFGIFGGFRGYYTVYRYATMIEKYSHIESRDLFLYRLGLNKREVEQLLEHAWELTNYAYHDYFFFDENCAFQLLAMLEAVKPEVDLVKKLPFYTSPLDVLKVASRAGLVARVDYQPSLYQNLLDYLQSMTPKERAAFYEFEAGDSDKVESKLVAEALILANNFRKHEKRGQISKYQESRRLGLLLTRSKMGTESPAFKSTQKISPHLSHGSKRVAAGVFFGRENHHGLSLRFRPGIHDLLSRGDGFQRNSSLKLFEANVLFDPYISKVFLQELDLVHLAKLKGNRFYQRLAWSMQLRFLRDCVNECERDLKPRSHLGLGVSRNILIERLDVYLLGKYVMRQFEENDVWDHGVGATLGMMLTPCRQIRWRTEITQAYNADAFSVVQLESGLQVDIGPDFDFRLQGSLERLSSSKKTRSWIIGEIGYSY